MADPRNFLFNSDYEQDQIVYFDEGNYTNVTTSGDERSFAHKLSFTPLIFGIWDNDGSFDFPNTINSEGKQTIVNSLGEIYFFNSIFVSADNTNIYVKMNPKMKADMSGTESTNFYFRLYAFEPTTSHATVGATAKHAHELIFSTDYNYLKIKKKGVVTASNGAVSVDHGLGYIPQVLDWYEFVVGGNTRTAYADSLSYAGSGYTPPIVSITESAVSFDRYNYASTKHHYRIYYDETK